MNIKAKILSGIIFSALISNIIGPVIGLPNNTAVDVTDPGLSVGSSYDSCAHIDSNGNLHVAWFEATLDEDHEFDTFYFNSLNNTTHMISTAPGDANGVTKNYLRGNLHTTSDNVAHVFWQEDMETADSYDSFYYNSGTNTTTNLSQTTTTTGASSNYKIKSLVGSDGSAHAIWTEYVDYTLHYTDLFYFDSRVGSAINISSHTMSDSYASEYKAVLDANNDIHIIWIENSSAPGHELDYFYYNGSTGTTSRISSQTNSLGGVDTNYKFKLDSNNNLHVVWLEMNSAPHGMDAFYYNGEFGTTRALTSLSTTAGNAQVINFRLTADNEAVVTWTERSSITADTDAFVWIENSDDLYNLSKDFIAGITSFANTPKIRMNSNGRFFITWIEGNVSPEHNPNLYVYDSEEHDVIDASSLAVDEGTAAGAYSPRLDRNGNLVVAFIQSTDNVDESTDMFLYMNSDTTTVRISNHLLSHGYVDGANWNIAMRFDLNNNPLVFWPERSQDHPTREHDVFFYNGATGETTVISDTTIPNGGVEFSYRHHKHIYTRQVADGRVDVIWFQRNTDIDLYYFNTGNNQRIKLSSDLLTSGSATEYTAKHDSLGNIYVSWVEESSAAGEGLDLFFYSNTEADIRRISDHLISTTYSNNYSRMLLSADTYKLYTTWSEDTIGEYKNQFVWGMDLPTPTPSLTPSPSGSVSPTGTPGDLTQTGQNMLIFMIGGIFTIGYVVMSYQNHRKNFKE